MRRVSLNARTAFDGAGTDEVEVALVAIEHGDLDAPVRLSTDPTERLTTDPLVYGTRSTWYGSDPATEPFQFFLGAAELPGDQEDVPPAAALILENVDPGLAALLRSITTPARVHLAVVLAASPDVIEAEFRDLQVIEAGGDAGEVRLTVSRAPIEEETVPMDRFTKARFPGLFR